MKNKMVQIKNSVSGLNNRMNVGKEKCYKAERSSSVTLQNGTRKPGSCWSVVECGPMHQEAASSIALQGTCPAGKINPQ